VEDVIVVIEGLVGTGGPSGAVVSGKPVVDESSEAGCRAGNATDFCASTTSSRCDRRPLRFFFARAASLRCFVFDDLLSVAGSIQAAGVSCGAPSRSKRRLEIEGSSELSIRSRSGVSLENMLRATDSMTTTARGSFHSGCWFSRQRRDRGCSRSDEDDSRNLLLRRDMVAQDYTQTPQRDDSHSME